MFIKNNNLRIFVCSGVLLLAGVLDARAQNPSAGSGAVFPSKPIRIVAPYLPGGGVDFVARAIAQKLPEFIGQQIIVENRPGGGTIIGSELVVRSAPDGYTLLLGGVPNTVNISLFKKLPYDLLRDLAPVILTTTAPNILAVHPSIPAKSVKELIAFAKSRPGELTFASAGIGSSNHLSGEMFRITAQINIVHVPYKGGGAAVVDLIAGHVSMYFGTTPSTVPHVRTGKLRGLAVTTAKRSRATPDVPTIAEAGLPTFEQSAWHGLFAPAATPPAVIARLNSDVMRVLRAPDFVERLGVQGVDALGNTPTEFAAFIRQDIEKYAKLVKVAGIRVE